MSKIVEGDNVLYRWKIWEVIYVSSYQEVAIFRVEGTKVNLTIVELEDIRLYRGK